MMVSLICAQVLIFLTCFTRSQILVQTNLTLVAEWNEPNFIFPSQLDESNALREGHYIPGVPIIIDVDVFYYESGKPRIFVTTPRIAEGIPITLSTAETIRGARKLGLLPYPNYSWQNSYGQDCNGITSVFRVAIDKCQRLWVLDNGQINGIQKCSPQLLVFDLRTDKLIHNYKIPKTQFKSEYSLFITPIVDVLDPPPKGTCTYTKVFMADVIAFGIVVYDMLTSNSWRIENKLMYPDPDYGTFNIRGSTFDLMDGVFGMSVSPVQEFKGSKNFYSSTTDQIGRYLFFHSLASNTENRVPLELLSNQTLYENNVNAEPRAFEVIGYRTSQSAAEAMDKKGNLYFGLMEPPSIAYWNSKKSFDKNSIKTIARNYETLQFASGLKIIENNENTEELWILTCRFQRYITGTKNSSEINYRILSCNTDDLINGRPCRQSKKNDFIFED